MNNYRRRMGCSYPPGCVEKTGARPLDLVISNGEDIYFFGPHDGTSGDSTWYYTQWYYDNPVPTGYSIIGVVVSGINGIPNDGYVRAISTKYMCLSSPDTGTADPDANGQEMYFGFNGYEIPNLSADRSLQSAYSHYDGKERTAIILQSCTALSNWKTAATITNNAINNHCPPAMCCWRYHTVGTKQGDWYLPAFGEYYYLYEENPNFYSLLVSILSSQYIIPGNGDPDNPNSVNPLSEYTSCIGSTSSTYNKYVWHTVNGFFYMVNGSSGFSESAYYIKRNVLNSCFAMIRF